MRCIGKTVLITGASSGIGQACALLLAAEGAHLILSARRAEKLQQLAQDLRNTHAIKVHVLPCDVVDAQAVGLAISHLPDEFKHIDILINNAGLALGLDKMHEGELADWDQMIDTNIKGVLHLIRAVLPGMLARESGHIINIGSTAGHQTYPGGSVYCASKHAVHAINKTLSLEMAGTKLRVTEIDPGMVETEFSRVRFKGDIERANKVYANLTPLTADDVADAVVYAVTRPKHVNIAQILLYCVDQPAAFRPG